MEGPEGQRSWEGGQRALSGPGRKFSYYDNCFAYKYCDSGRTFLVHPHESGVKFGSDSVASPRREAAVTHNVLAPRSFRWRFFAWKIGPLSSFLRISPLPPLLPSGN